MEVPPPPPPRAASKLSSTPRDIAPGPGPAPYLMQRMYMYVCSKFSCMRGGFWVIAHPSDFWVLVEVGRTRKGRDDSLLSVLVYIWSSLFFSMMQSIYHVDWPCLTLVIVLWWNVLLNNILIAHKFIHCNNLYSYFRIKTWIRVTVLVSCFRVLILLSFKPMQVMRLTIWT